MATSGSTDFTLSGDAIITSALRKLRRINPRLSVPAVDITYGRESLNVMIKAWQMDGVFLWLNEEVLLHLQYNTQFYSLGPTGDNCCLLSDAGKTQLSAAAAAAATALSVDSITGATDGDYLGIQLDGGTIQWTTINGTPSGTTITAATGLTGAAAADNYVFFYTNKIARPLRITEARLRDTDDEDTPLRIVSSRDEFMSNTDKTSQGETLDLHYNPDITNGQLYTWPIAGTSDITDRIVMTVQRVIEDFDASANNYDGPVECLQALIWCLAAELAPEYGIDILSGKGASIALNADKYYKQMKRFYSNLDPVHMRR